MRMYACGVQKDKCCGSTIQSSHGVPLTKAHASSEEAFNCKRRSLLADGYEQVGSREFTKGDGPILLLDRKSKFGGVMKRGKNEKGTGKRFMPRLHPSGLIV